MPKFFCGHFMVLFWAKNAPKMGVKWVKNGRVILVKNHQKELMFDKKVRFFQKSVPKMGT